jgi:peptidylprolyl isomerase
MTAAKSGDKVQIHYTGKLDDGTVFDTSRERGPLEFTLGTGQVIPGFEEAVAGMVVGDTKTTRIEAQDAYGPRREELLKVVPRDELPDGLEPKLGDRYNLQGEQGETIQVKVSEMSKESITLDANHPLAGEALTFELELMGIA